VFNINVRVVLAAAGSVALALCLFVFISYLAGHPGLAWFFGFLLAVVVGGVVAALIWPMLRR